MNLREQLQHFTGKEDIHRLAKAAATDMALLKEVVNMFLHEEDSKLVHRAGWVLGNAGQQNPEAIMPYLPAMLRHMQEASLPVSVKRNVVRILQYMNVPEALHGDVMNLCFDLLADPKETVAVRAFCMTTLANLTTTYPELKQELTAILEDMLQHEPTPGLASRAKKTLKDIRKLP